MSGPVANVQNVISIDGVYSASDAVAKAQNALKGLQVSAAETGRAAGGISEGLDASKVQQTTQRMGGAFSALAAAMGPAASQVAEIGRSATALGSTANVLPGPLGLAAAAAVGLGVGVKMLAGYFKQAAAASELLHSPAARKLGEDMDFSAQQTAKLSQALSSLRGNELVPSDALLKEVADNAVRLGQDPAENVAKFVAAWKDGPEAIAAVQSEIGKLSMRLQSVHDVALSLRLDPSTLGLEKAVGSAERLAAHIRDVAKARADASANEAAYAVAKATADAAQGVANADDLRALREKEAAAKRALDTAQRQVQTSELFARSDAQALRTAQGIAELEKFRADLDQATESKASVARTKAEAHRIRLNALQNDRVLIERQIAALEAAQSVLGDKDVKDKTTALKQLLLQLDVRTKGEKDAARSDAKAAADAANAKSTALLQAQTAAVRARADRDGIQTEFERYELLRLEHEQAVKTANEQRDPKLRTAQRKAADEKYRTDRAGIERAIAVETEQVNAELEKTLKEGTQRQLAAQQAAADVSVQLQQAKARSLADVLRAQGKVEAAELTEARQLRADHEAELARIDRERIASLAGVNAASVEAADIQAAAANKVLLAELALAEKERQLAAAKRERTLQAVDLAGQALDAVGQRLQSIGGESNIAAAAFGQSISAMSRGLSALGKIADSDAQKVSKTVAAVGDAAAGVANAIISASSRRALAQLDIEEQQALKGAKTEEQRAAIVEQFEKRKADARDAGTRQSAAIQALFASAQAIAYAFTPGMQWAAVGQGVAAAAFAAIAGGAAGSSYTPGAAAGGAGFNAGGTGSAGGSGGSGSGGGVTQIYNFNQPFSTPQEIAKTMNSYQQSLKGTGFQKSRAGF